MLSVGIIPDFTNHHLSSSSRCWFVSRCPELGSEYEESAYLSLVTGICRCHGSPDMGKYPGHMVGLAEWLLRFWSLQTPRRLDRLRVEDVTGQPPPSTPVSTADTDTFYVSYDMKEVWEVYVFMSKTGLLFWFVNIYILYKILYLLSKCHLLENKTLYFIISLKFWHVLIMRWATRRPNFQEGISSRRFSGNLSFLNLRSSEKSVENSEKWEEAL